MKVAVTGGAGFIGSHLVDELIRKNHEALVVDSLVSGVERNINEKAKLIKKDIVTDDLAADLEGVEAVFHFAADPDVRSSAENPSKSFTQNVVGTFNLLEACRAMRVKRFVFASTSTVYGETKTIPTPETEYCKPISNYGASKLACEAYISAYAYSYGLQSTVLRFANIFGPRSNHGVMYDFYHKLKNDPTKLEILGDGLQEKSYLFISDTISATMTAYEKQQNLFDVYNVGSREKKTVNEIGKLVSRTLDTKPKTAYTGTPRGWVGDVRLMQLDVAKLETLGWKPEVSFEDGVKIYIDWLKESKN
jgi:UDP-glucose 4-epimerase